MNLKQSQQLVYLLQELINAQDSVTHLNEKGPEFVENTQHFIEKRNRIYKGIVDFVEELTESKQKDG